MIRAYHFVGDKLRDGRPIPPDGEWLVHYGPVEMCASGLHYSRKAFDALQYAPGPVLCLVDVDDIVAEHGDKGVCRRRRIGARIDASRMLHEFAADCAEDVWHLVPPGARVATAWAIDAARRFTRGETDADELAAARDAAWDAASAAAWAAAWDAAWDAASAAASAVARDAASAAASAAAWDAAWDAASAAAWDAARAAARAAASAAAWDAASAAASAAQRDRFAALVNDAFAAAMDGKGKP